MIKKLKFAIPVSLLLASSLAFSVLPAAILAPLGSATVNGLAGLLFWYGFLDTRPAQNQQPVRVYVDLKNDPDITASDLPAPSNFTPPTIPQQTTRSLVGGDIIVDIPQHTFSGTTYAGGTFEGPVDQVVENMRYAAVPPHRYATTTTGSQLQGITQTLAASANNTVRVTRHFGTYSPTHPAHPCFLDAAGVCRTLSQGTSFNTNLPVTSATTPTVTGNYAKIMITSSNGNTAQILLPLWNAEQTPCPVGYAVNATDVSKCDLISYTQAQADESTTMDGKCIVGKDGNLKNPADIDCTRLQQAGGIWRDTSGIFHAKDPSGSLSPDTIAIRPRADGGTDIGISKKNADGSGSLTDLEIALDGIAKAIRTYNHAPPYIPTYPGAPPGSGNPSGVPSISVGAGGSTCGGPNQPPCAIKPGEGFWDGLADALGLGDGDEPGEGEPLPGGDDAPCTDCQQNTQKKEDFFGTLLEFNNFDLNLGDPSCHSAFSGFDRTITLGSESFDISITPVCDLLEDEKALIRNLFLIGWTLLALFVLLSKVK